MTSKAMTPLRIVTALKNAIDDLARSHGPFSHDFIKDEQACARCARLVEYRAALAAAHKLLEVR